jgi:hypothetical protein
LRLRLLGFMASPCFGLPDEWRRYGQGDDVGCRVEKILEDALLKISVVISDLFGVSGRRFWLLSSSRVSFRSGARGPGRGAVTVGWVA